jgi:hypothetical protein
MDGGMIQDKMFFLNTASGDSEVWWFDTGAQRWIRMAGTDIQSVLGYPLEVTNPETGLTFLVERRGFSRGRWQDWLDRWKGWEKWDKSDQNLNKRKND